MIAECAEVTQRATARTERARADIEVSRAGIEAARKRQEEAVAQQKAAIARQEAAIARQEAATAKLEELEVRREADGDWMREAMERHEELLQRQLRGTDEIIAELRDQRDERRALIEALLRMTDRLPPPPPHLKSA